MCQCAGVLPPDATTTRLERELCATFKCTTRDPPSSPHLFRFRHVFEIDIADPAPMGYLLAKLTTIIRAGMARGNKTQVQTLHAHHTMIGPRTLQYEVVLVM